MSEYAPAAIQGLFDKIEAGTNGAAIMGGIVGDQAHYYGYHRCRNVLPDDDYSVQLPDDRQGDGDAACGLDISWSDASWQTRASQRLMDALHDSRMYACREAYGSVNGSDVCGCDYTSGWLAWSGASDDSHLWHVHLSILRRYANDAAALDGIAQVITGGSGGSTPPSQPPSGGTLRRPWPSYMPMDEYFGLITGPDASHGGYYASEQPDVAAIQQRLQALGYAPTAPGWADGIYEQPTADAVAAWQRDLYAALTSRYGEVWNDDWGRLFTY